MIGRTLVGIIAVTAVTVALVCWILAPLQFESEERTSRDRIQSSPNTREGKEVAQDIGESVSGSIPRRENYIEPELHGVRILGDGVGPLPGARVRVYSAVDGRIICDTKSDSEGRVSFDKCEASSFVVLADFERVGVQLHGYRILKMSRAEEMNTEWDVHADASQPFVLVGVARDQDSVEGLWVELQSREKRSLKRVGDLGIAVFESPQSDSLAAVVDTEFGALCRETFGLFERESMYRVLVVPSGVVEVALKTDGEPNGLELQGMAVCLESFPFVPGNLQLASFASSDGVARFRGLPPGRYVASTGVRRPATRGASMEGTPVSATLVELESGIERVELTVGMPRIVGVAAIRNTDSRPVPAEVYIALDEIGPLVGVDRPVRTQRFSETLMCIPQGEVRLVAYSYRFGWGEVHVPEGIVSGAEVKIVLDSSLPRIEVGFSDAFAEHPERVTITDSSGRVVMTWTRPPRRKIKVNGEEVGPPTRLVSESGEDLGLLPVVFVGVPLGEVCITATVGEMVVGSAELRIDSDSHVSL